MAGQVQLAFARGGSIAVEVEGAAAPAGGRDLGGRGLGDDTAQRVTQTFDETLSSLNSMADSLHAALRASLTPPDAVTVQFGVNFSVTGGLIVAKGTGGASLNITMQWNKG
jgi:hypothetical protein